MFEKVCLCFHLFSGTNQRDDIFVQVSVVLCLEVVVAFLIQVTIFHDPVRSKATILTLSQNCIHNTRLICFLFMPKFNNAHQAHWTDLLGAMCILLAVTGMGFESKVIQNV